MSLPTQAHPEDTARRARMVEEIARGCAASVVRAVRAERGERARWSDLSRHDRDAYLCAAVDAPALLWWRDNELGNAIEHLVGEALGK